MSLSAYQRAFVKSMAAAADAVCPPLGICVPVCVGQACLETGWGNAKRAAAQKLTFAAFAKQTGYNFFGIKGRGDAGSQLWKTQEYMGVQPTGHWVTIQSNFAKYSSVEAGVRAYCALLSNSRYRLARDHFADDPGRFVTYVWASGYATSPNYPNVILSVLRTVAGVTGEAAYRISTDAGLQAVIARMQGVTFGKPRIAVRDEEMATFFRRPASAEPASSGVPAKTVRADFPSRELVDGVAAASFDLDHNEEDIEAINRWLETLRELGA